MPDANQPNPSLGDGGAAVQARLPGPSPAVLRAIPDQVVLDPKAAAATRYRWRVLLVLAGLVLAFGLYWGSSYVFAYTDDAYVTSDLVGVAPQITGRIIAVPIVDNQTVAKGTLLAEIDPTPFRLELAKQVAKRSEAEAQLAVDHDLVKSAKAARDEAAAKARLASDNLQRDSTDRRRGIPVASGARHRDGYGAGSRRGTCQCRDGGRQTAPDGGIARSDDQVDHR